MRRPSKAFLYVLTIGVVAVLVSIGLYLYNEEKAHQEQLLSEIALAQETIDQLRATDMSALETEIANLEDSSRTAESRIATLERILRQYTHSIEIEEQVFEAAVATGVEIVQITARPAELAEREGVLVEVFPMIVVAESAVPPSLVNFSIEVTDTLESAEIEGVAMEYPEPTEDDAEGEEEAGDTEEQASRIQLRLSVYYLSGQ